MNKRIATLFFISFICIKSKADDSFPNVSDDFKVALFAQEPLVRNPCAITFDKLGRLCVGMGPQYRKPKPETKGDSVWIILDKNGDGSADSRIEFASGFNSIQGLAWKGNDLWVANAPDLTLVCKTNAICGQNLYSVSSCRAPVPILPTSAAHGTPLHTVCFLH